VAGAPRYNRARVASLDERRAQALSDFRVARYSDAASQFATIAAESNSDTDWFNLMTSSALAKQVDVAERTFNMLHPRIVARVEEHNRRLNRGEPVNPSDFEVSPAELVVYYGHAMCDGGAPHRALALVADLAKSYAGLVITDATFLYIRRFPTFETFASLLKKISDGVGAPAIVPIVETLSRRVDKEGLTTLRENGLLTP